MRINRQSTVKLMRKQKRFWYDLSITGNRNNTVFAQSRSRHQKNDTWRYLLIIVSQINLLSAIQIYHMCLKKSTINFEIKNKFYRITIVLHKRKIIYFIDYYWAPAFQLRNLNNSYFFFKCKSYCFQYRCSSIISKFCMKLSK